MAARNSIQSGVLTRRAPRAREERSAPPKCRGGAQGHRHLDGAGWPAAEIGRVPSKVPLRAAPELAAEQRRCSQAGSRLSRCRGRTEGRARPAGRLLHLPIAPSGLLRPDTTRLERAAHAIGMHALAERRTHIDQGVQNGEPFCCPDPRKELPNGSSRFRLLTGLATLEPPSVDARNDARQVPVDRCDLGDLAARKDDDPVAVWPHARRTPGAARVEVRCHGPQTCHPLPRGRSVDCPLIGRI